MARSKTQSTVYGFEQYDIRYLGALAFKMTPPISNYEYHYFNYYLAFQAGTIYLCDKGNQLPDLASQFVIENTYPTDEGLVNTAKTLYVHPSCKLSRSMVFQKYQKTLNPWLADAIVVPKLSYYDVSSSTKIAVFISEKSQMIFIVSDLSYYEETDNLFSDDKILGKSLLQLLKVSEDDILGIKTHNYNVEALLDAELIYVGKAFSISNKSALNDLVQNAIPRTKLINEDTIMYSLGNEENQLSVESLVSISEMLNSQDVDTVNAALKALSTMDYIHYPNSVILVLRESWNNYRWKKAMHSTAVKYMMSHFCSNGRTRYIPSFKDDYITQKDYDIFKELLPKMNLYSKNYMLEHECPFIYKDADLEFKARIKD